MSYIVHDLLMYTNTIGSREEMRSKKRQRQFEWLSNIVTFELFCVGWYESALMREEEVREKKRALEHYPSGSVTNVMMKF